MLAVAYGASIGGVGTLIGTPPNAIFAANARQLAGTEVGFGDWLLIGLPVEVLMLAACWAILVRLFRVKGVVAGLIQRVEREAAELPPPGLGERFVTAVFVLTALAWVLREPKQIGSSRIPGLPALPLMAAGALGASMAFMLPVATPPNAIVFGSGLVDQRDMAKAGFWMNLASMVVVTTMAWWRRG
jgi:sodium-dependent dicarboxylate transporter 2/3/5